MAITYNNNSILASIGLILIFSSSCVCLSFSLSLSEEHIILSLYFNRYVKILHIPNYENQLNLREAMIFFSNLLLCFFGQLVSPEPNEIIDINYDQEY